MKDIIQNSLIFYLYQSLKNDFSHMGASSKCRVFTQSIQFCQCTLISAVIVALPALWEKLSLAWKPSVKTKHGSPYWAHLYSLPFQRKYSSPNRNTRDQLKQFNLSVACGSTAFWSNQNFTGWQHKLKQIAYWGLLTFPNLLFTLAKDVHQFTIRNTEKTFPALECPVSLVDGLSGKKNLALGQRKNKTKISPSIHLVVEAVRAGCCRTGAPTYPHTDKVNCCKSTESS